MQRKICLITGATSGIGLVTARTLAQQGATVMVVGRHPERGAATVARLKYDTGNTAIGLLIADLSSQEQIRTLAHDFQARFSRLDLLINNAGAIFMRRQVSVDGIEMTFALNHLGYFLLTHLLLETLAASAAARIINVSSEAHRRARIDFTDLQGQRRYNGWRAYGQSKLANLLFTYGLAARLQSRHITVNAVHPGFVATNFGNNNAPPFTLILRLLKLAALRPEQGARTMIDLATAPATDERTGAYFINGQPAPSSARSYHQEDAERLWQLSLEMTGLEANTS